MPLYVAVACRGLASGSRVLSWVEMKVDRLFAFPLAATLIQLMLHQVKSVFKWGSGAEEYRPIFASPDHVGCGGCRLGLGRF